MDPFARLNFVRTESVTARPGADASNAARTRDAAEAFETFFLSQTFAQMRTDISAEPPFGGGSGERAFQSFLNEAYAKAIVRSGGVGLSDRLMADILARQAQDDAGR